MKKTTRILAIFLAIATLLSIVSVGAFASSAASGDIFAAIKGTVNTNAGSTLNVRTGPSTSNSVVSALNSGASINIVGYASDSSGQVWFRISSPSGYVHSDYVSSSDSKAAKISGNSVNIRNSASASSASLKIMNNQESITVIAVAAGSDGYAWLKISNPVQGYVRADLVSAVSSANVTVNATRAQLIAKAKTLVDRVYYFWGGKYSSVGENPEWGKLKKVTDAGSSKTGQTIPYGLDCSGLVDWTFYQFGYKKFSGINSTAQFNILSKVSKANLKPGDIGHQSGHIGIYAGDGYWIHASGSAGKVVCNQYTGFTEYGRVGTFIGD